MQRLYYFNFWPFQIQQIFRLWPWLQERDDPEDESSPVAQRNLITITQEESAALANRVLLISESFFLKPVGAIPREILGIH